MQISLIFLAINLFSFVSALQKDALIPCRINIKTKASSAIGATPVPASNTIIGSVVRIGARKYDKEASKPSSRRYTTKKDEQRDGAWIGKDGVAGDYNHYRTMALKGTLDRAVSILTSDALKYLQSCGYTSIANGDLGENLSLQGISYWEMEPKQQYCIRSSSSGTDPNLQPQPIILEITEPIIPCANLCKLPFINEETKTPAERVQACSQFLEILGTTPGLRGWYAKVIQEGRVDVGSVVEQLDSDDK